jgi:hypothetical protein
MTPKTNRINSWIAVGIIATPFLWAAPTYYYLSSQTNKKSAQCETNMAQIAQAMTQYASENDGHLPNAKTWVQDLELSVDVLRCPADHDKEHPVSYAMNRNFSGKKLADIKEPQKAILVYESQSKEASPFGTGEDIIKIGKDTTGQGRHNTVGYRFNYYVTADGKALWPQDLKELKTLRWK